MNSIIDTHPPIVATMHKIRNAGRRLKKINTFVCSCYITCCKISQRHSKSKYQRESICDGIKYNININTNDNNYNALYYIHPPYILHYDVWNKSQ